MQPGQVPGQDPFQPQIPVQSDPTALGYGQNFLDHGPTGPTKESVGARLSFPGSSSIIFSSIYMALLSAGIGWMVTSFITTANDLEVTRAASAVGGVEGRGAKARKNKMNAKRQREYQEEVYQYSRRILFTSFGIGLVLVFTALTGQCAGVVSGRHMVGLRSYRWAFWCNIFAAFPFLSTFYLITLLATEDLSIVGGGTTIVLSLILYGILDGIRFILSLWCLLMLLGGSTRKFFSIK